MLEIVIHASSSKGNAYSIIEGEKRMLIDPGIRFSILLHLSGYTISHNSFCLVSHEHKDHSMSAKDVSKFGVPCFMSCGTQDVIKCPATIIKSEVPFEVAGWNILPFETQHDAAEPLGFLIETPKKKRILFATDTYYIKYRFSGITHFMVECNYQKELLDTNEEMHPVHKDRVRRSHFELSNVVEFFRQQDLSKTEKIYLIHLSDDNSDEKMFVSEVEKATGLPVYVFEM